jgi:RimJ/RimL family protein N-acetyltransferase
LEDEVRESHEVALKGGFVARIRSLHLDDAAGVLAAERAIAAAGAGSVMLLEELPADVDVYRERLRPWVEGPGSESGWFAVAEADGAIAGSGTIRKLGPLRARHVAHLTVGIHPEHQGRGLGRAIVRRLVGWALDAGALRIDLFVLADNHRAIALYESVGFRVEATRRRIVRDPDGRMRDDHIMVLFRDEAGTS